MLKIQAERERQGRSRAEVARAASLNGSVYGWIDSGRFTPYDVQLERIAVALGWPKDRARELLEVERADVLG